MWENGLLPYNILLKICWEPWSVLIPLNALTEEPAVLSQTKISLMQNAP